MPIPFMESTHEYHWPFTDLDAILDIVDAQLSLAFDGTGEFIKKQLLIINGCEN